MACESGELVGDRDLLRCEVPRRWQQHQHRQADEDGDPARGQHRDAPVGELQHCAGDEAAEEPSDARAGNIESHYPRQMFGIDFLGEVGHDHRRDAGHSHALQGTHEQQRADPGRDGHQQAQEGGGHDADLQDAVAPQPLGEDTDGDDG